MTQQSNQIIKLEAVARREKAISNMFKKFFAKNVTANINRTDFDLQIETAVD